ncbi:transposase family protein [Saccharopolyspora elongata]|uniref:transposase family protein n=1 Tax=Saccharopolyspora elongata TaxID=2530387 RepID=UPI0014046D91|nr:transposase family protein [Saccharopolyspora elongata]
MSSSPVLDCPVESGPARPAPVVDVGWPVPQGLLKVLTGVADPRKRRGVRHRLAVVLAIALAATLAGHTTIAAACRHHARDSNRPVELLLTS